MDSSKGFSLIEVLLSLLIITTLILNLLELRWQAELAFNGLIADIASLHAHDRNEERLLATRLSTLS